MTMAKVENGTVTQVGLPINLRSFSRGELKQMGWRKVVGAEKPADSPELGYQWEYGADWSTEDGVVYGTWTQKQRPQPFPSWSWVDGEGWQPPVPRPDGEYYWDEAAQEWKEEVI